MPLDSSLSSPVSTDIILRANRERDFFNHHTDPATIPDEALIVPKILDAIPEEVAEYMPDLKDKHICEVGCGYGIISCYFAQRGACVSGFDISETNVCLAERAAQINGMAERVSLQVMPGECMAFADNKFDLVFGNAVLHHLDIVSAAREIYRVLKPGGIAIFREPFGENRLLEWGRNCSWRSSSHRHTDDEHSLCYRDVEILRTVFPKVIFRESELLSVFRYFLRKAEIGMIAVPRFEKATRRLERLDRWLLSRVPALRRFASYSVVSMFKPEVFKAELVLRNSGS
ncbi:MAG TPA: class I SAM-dependent methyltransferase [Terriglobales bacterium]|nr:class I SAM-dependent methyltransferase [Terriglobales bacterium]